MSITISAAEAMSLTLGAAALFFGALKFFLGRFLGQMEKRFDQLGAALQAQASGAVEFREELLRLQVELPMSYVRREDDIRNQSVISAKLDALYQKIEDLRERVQ